MASAKKTADPAAQPAAPKKAAPVQAIPAAPGQTLPAEVAKFIRDNKLAGKLNKPGKFADMEFVQVEGWQYAGFCLGLDAVVVDVRDITQPGALCVTWLAKVEIRDRASQALVGSGFAEASGCEGRGNLPASAVLSMAQTRAIAKAFRNCLGWLVRTAGFEATPLEEMKVFSDAVQNNQPAAQDAPAAPQATNEPQDDAQPAATVESPAEAEKTAKPETAPEQPARRADNSHLRPEGTPARAPQPRQADPAAAQAVPKPDARAQQAAAYAQINQSVAGLKNALKAEDYLQPGALLATGKEGALIGITEPDNAGNRYATLEQKQQLVELLTKPYFTNAERSQALLGLHKASSARASESVQKMLAEYELRWRRSPEKEPDAVFAKTGHPALG